MDEFFKGKRNTQDDYYSILGCCETSSTEQILAEYKLKVLKYHPDKNPHNSCVQDQFLKLQEAKEILTTPAKRKDYDMWRNSGMTISYQCWVSMRGESTPVFHWATTSRSQGRMLELEVHKSSDCIQESYRHPTRGVGISGYSRDVIAKFRNYEI